MLLHYANRYSPYRASFENTLKPALQNNILMNSFTTSFPYNVSIGEPDNNIIITTCMHALIFERKARIVNFGHALTFHMRYFATIANHNHRTYL